MSFDIAFTSVLTRAQHTLDLALAEIGQTGLPIKRDLALNERDYGDLSGLNKDDARKKWGEEQVLIWRRSYDVPPPGGESLKDTLARDIALLRARKFCPACCAASALWSRRTAIRCVRFDHGAGKTVAGKYPETRARHRGADHLPAECRLHRGVEARSGMSAAADIVVLDGAVSDTALDLLASVLVDCVEGGASVSFMLPFSQADGVRFFRKVTDSIASGDTVLLAARLDGKIVGTVQLGLDTPPNQPHRADIKKLLVNRSARGHGVGAALMARVEQEAKIRGRWLLVLDTVPGENGYRLYTREGWTRSGIIPDYALFPDGRLCDTAVFWKRLDR